MPNLGIRVPALQLRRFWTMLSHYHGQVLNVSEIGRSLGLSDTAVRHYLDILTGTLLVQQLAVESSIGRLPPKMKSKPHAASAQLKMRFKHPTVRIKTGSVKDRVFLSYEF